MTLTKEQIVAAARKAPETIEVAVKEWGGKVRLAKLGAGPALALGRRCREMPRDDAGRLLNSADVVEFYVVLLANSIVDDKLQPLFLDADGQQFLRQQSLGLLMALGDEAIQLNGLGGDAQPVEDAKKNSKAVPTGSSRSGSASGSATRTRTT